MIHHHSRYQPKRFSVSCYYHLQARSWLSSRLKAGISDDFVPFLGGHGHLVQLSCTAAPTRAELNAARRAAHSRAALGNARVLRVPGADADDNAGDRNRATECSRRSNA